MGDQADTLLTLVNDSETALAELNQQAVEMARLTQLAVSSHSDQMGRDLKNAMRIAQLEAASGGKLTAQALSKELGIGIRDVQRILDSFGIEAPASLSTTGSKMIGSWASSLASWPGDTRTKAQETSSAVTDSLGGLPAWTNTAGEMTKNEWGSKMDVATIETATKAAAWAKALIDNLNPILTGIGAQAIGGAVGSAGAAGKNALDALNFAAGGIVERHDPQIAQGGPVRIWNEPELPWEGYVSGDPSKKGRSVAITKEIAKRLGMVAVERAEGGIDEFGLTVPPVLSTLFGDMLGRTTDAGTGYAYEAARQWAAAQGIGAAGSGGGPSGPAPPGSVTDWVRATANIVGVGESWVPPGYRRVMYESSGDPNAINLYDINAQNGIPSKGLWQTIDPTFQHYKLAGYDDIWNPIHNGIAAMRYILDVYGSIFAIDPPTSGYRAGGIIDYALMDRGGTLKPGLTLVQNNTGRNEHVAGPGQSVVNTGEMSTATSHTGTQGSASNTMSITSTNGMAGSSGSGTAPPGIDMGISRSATSVDNSSHISFAPNFSVEAHIAPGMDTGAITAAVRSALTTSKEEILRDFWALLRMHGVGAGRGRARGR